MYLFYDSDEDINNANMDGVDSNSLCDHARDKQHQTTAQRKSDLLIISMTAEWIGRHDVLLPNNRNNYDFPQKAKASFEEELLIVIFKYRNFTILESQSLELVTIVIVMNVVIGSYSGEDLKWLAHVTVRLKVSDYS